MDPERAMRSEDLTLLRELRGYTDPMTGKRVEPKKIQDIIRPRTDPAIEELNSLISKIELY